MEWMINGGWGFEIASGGSAATAPAAFSSGQWSVADKNTDGAITITVSAIPYNGSSALTALQYRINGGSWVTMSGTSTGARDVTGLANSVQVTVELRAVNAVGNGLDSDDKTVIPRLAEMNLYRAACTTPPSLGREVILTALIAGLKTDSVWTKLDWLLMMAAETEQAGRVNLRTPSKVASRVNSMTFTTDRGFTGNASNMHLDFGEVPNAGGNVFALNSAHIGVWINGGSTTAQRSMGQTSSSTLFIHTRGTSGTQTAQINDATNETYSTLSSPASVSGHRIATRTGASTKRGAMNGTAAAGGTTTSTSITAANLCVGRSSSIYDDKRYAAAHSGGGLTDADMLAIYNRLNTAMTAIGANV